MAADIEAGQDVGYSCTFGDLENSLAMIVR
jgi:hypothetical protein